MEQYYASVRYLMPKTSHHSPLVIRVEEIDGGRQFRFFNHTQRAWLINREASILGVRKVFEATVGDNLQEGNIVDPVGPSLQYPP